MSYGTEWRQRRCMVITVPAWGDEYCRLFLGPVLRSHFAAIAAARAEFKDTLDFRYVVQTDRPALVAQALDEFDLTLIPCPSKVGAIFSNLCEGHMRGIETARAGDRIVLLNADIMVPTGAFIKIERAIRKGKKAVVCGGIRTVMGRFVRFPPPLPNRDLAAWAWARPHPITKNLTWGTGLTTHPSMIYFQQGGNIVLRGFHLHPIAVVKDRDLPFIGSIDLNLVDNYSFDEIHVCTGIDDLMLAEVSGGWKTHDAWDRVLDVSQVLAWAMRGAREKHWWNFRHRIIIAGDADADAGDSAVADEVLRLCPYSAVLDAAL